MRCRFARTPSPVTRGEPNYADGRTEDRDRQRELDAPSVHATAPFRNSCFSYGEGYIRVVGDKGANRSADVKATSADDRDLR